MDESRWVSSLQSVFRKACGAQMCWRDKNPKPITMQWRSSLRKIQKMEAFYYFQKPLLFAKISNNLYFVDLLNSKFFHLLRKLTTNKEPKC